MGPVSTPTGTETDAMVYTTFSSVGQSVLSDPVKILIIFEELSGSTQRLKIAQEQLRERR